MRSCNDIFSRRSCPFKLQVSFQSYTHPPPRTFTLQEEMESGLEVTPWNDPEIIAQPDANKYFIKAEQPKDFFFNKSLPSGQSIARSRDWRKLFFLLALFAFLSLAVAVGAGLGVGLAAQHRPAPSSGPAASTPVANSLISETTSLANVIHETSVPSTPSNAQSDRTVTKASQPRISATVSSPVCPADDRSAYIATNKPSRKEGPDLEITNTSLVYQIYCYTNYVGNPPVIDLQTLYDVTSLQGCLEACALYSFQTKPVDFPAFACTGIAWAAGATRICWLKSNVTSSSANGTDEYPGITGAVMVQ